MQATSDMISRLMARFNTRKVHIPAKKNANPLGAVKDDLGVKVPGIYCIK
jgi:hypothetical protein